MILAFDPEWSSAEDIQASGNRARSARLRMPITTIGVLQIHGRWRVNRDLDRDGEAHIDWGSFGVIGKRFTTRIACPAPADPPALALRHR